jgi:hypothetical protein
MYARKARFTQSGRAGFAVDYAEKVGGYELCETTHGIAGVAIPL